MDEQLYSRAHLYRLIIRNRNNLYLQQALDDVFIDNIGHGEGVEIGDIGAGLEEGVEGVDIGADPEEGVEGVGIGADINAGPEEGVDIGAEIGAGDREVVAEVENLDFEFVDDGEIAVLDDEMVFLESDDDGAYDLDSDDDVVYDLDDDVDDGDDNDDNEMVNDDQPNVENEEEQQQLTLSQQFATLVRKFGWTVEAVDCTLKLLRRHGLLELPNCRKTLLKTPTKKIVLRTCAPGFYFHFGLKKCLLRSNYSFLTQEPTVEIDINIDGVALTKSSSSKMMPILGAFVNRLNISPFLIGIYTGNKDPEDVDVFLEEFVAEAKALIENGCEVTTNKIRKPFKIRTFICDMVGRSYIKSVKGHQSLYGCDKCTQKCFHIDGKMVYQTVSGRIRTDESFRNRRDVTHHQPNYVNQMSLLESLDLGMVSQFVVDDMHAVHLGVTRRFLKNLFHNKCNLCRLTPLGLKALDRKYIALAPFVCSEFERRPRSIILELPKWKAVEFRLFLLYTGIVVLKRSAGVEVYNQFLLLAVAIRLLSTPDSYRENADVAHDLLTRFVEDYPRVVHPKEMVYNNHVLLHIVDEVKRYGPLGTFSAYKFENHQREIKKLIKKPNQIIQQINNRLEEIATVNEIHSSNGLIGNQRRLDRDYFPGCNSSYRGFQFDSFKIVRNIKDSCCQLSNGQTVEVQDFVRQNDEIMIIVKLFVNKRELFAYPMSSLLLGIMVVDGPEDELFMFRKDDILFKYMRLPNDDIHDDNTFVLLPILHHLK